MQFRVSRDNQEYGPYTIEELTLYVNEGSLLPNDYVHNGMEWVHLSEFLKNPHRAATSMHSVSSAANAKPDWKSSTSKNSGSEPKQWSIFDIIDWFFQDAIFSNWDADEAKKFNNRLAASLECYTYKLDSLDIEIDVPGYGTSF